jgi:hypothetical protein
MYNIIKENRKNGKCQHRENMNKKVYETGDLSYLDCPQCPDCKKECYKTCGPSY